jgi:hypothetical protein
VLNDGWSNVGWMAQGVSVCNAGLEEIDEDSHPVDIVVIDGYKESVVQ